MAAALLGSSITFTSCFKEEPLNAEADITEAYIHTDNPLDLFANLSDTLVKVISSENEIRFNVKRHSDISQMAPYFKLTEGATISPSNGSVHDFTNGPVNYQVTSQDGEWTRQYQVSFVFPPVVHKEMRYDFEDYYLNENKPVHRYYVWNDKNDDGTRANNWATGNPGFNLSKGSAKPDAYPTVPVEAGAEGTLEGSGACVKLTTRDTGPLGMTGKMPIAAGNLFIGKFDPAIALKDAMKATQFGMPVSFMPVKFSGYYKYERGPKFTDRQKKEVKDRLDYGTIYAVLYDNHNVDGEAITLYGDDVQTSEQVVAIAKMPDIDNTTEWTKFDLDFEYRKKIDMEKLSNMGYSLTIVCSSSVEGASFMGAIGSTLWVDQFCITCEKGDE